MPELRPTLLRRMLVLRQFPLFGDAALDELATMAENVVGASFAAGTLIAPASSRLSAVQLVISGRIETRPRAFAWGPRQVFGELEVAASRELARPVLAVEPTETLQLSASDFIDVLEDNFGVMLSALRALATRMIEVVPPAPRTASPAAGARPLGLVERLILLRQQLPFGAARLQPLAMLAHASDEKTWPARTLIAKEGEPATWGLVVIQGTLRARRDDGTLHMLGPGQHVGFAETLAATSRSYTLEAITPVRALTSPGPAILDVLEDHADLGVAMISAFAAALLDARTDAVPLRLVASR